MDRKMTKVEAIAVIDRQGSMTIRKAIDYRRAIRALQTLGLSEDEIEQALRIMEFHDEQGPYPWTQEK